MDNIIVYFFFNLLVDVSMRGQLKDQMDLLFVIKEPKHFEYIRVIQICLYFDLLLQRTSLIQLGKFFEIVGEKLT